MTEDDIDILDAIFLREHAYGYSLTFDDKEYKDKYNIAGWCNPIDKEIRIFTKVAHDLMFQKVVILHEIAHANTSGGHTYKWVQEFIRLLEKYKVPKAYVAENVELGPNLFKWVQSV